MFKIHGGIVVQKTKFPFRKFIKKFWSTEDAVHFYGFGYVGHNEINALISDGYEQNFCQLDNQKSLVICLTKKLNKNVV